MRTFVAVLIAGLLAAASFAALADKININEADAAALATLNGIGQSRAEAIIEYRKTNGPFRSVDELAFVKGLGQAVLDRNRDRITVGSDPVPQERAAAD